MIITVVVGIIVIGIVVQLVSFFATGLSVIERIIGGAPRFTAVETDDSITVLKVGDLSDPDDDDFDTGTI